DEQKRTLHGIVQRSLDPGVHVAHTGYAFQTVHRLAVCWAAGQTIIILSYSYSSDLPEVHDATIKIIPTPQQRTQCELCLQQQASNLIFQLEAVLRSQRPVCAIGSSLMCGSEAKT